MRKLLGFYTLATLLFASIIWYIIQAGQSLEVSRNLTKPAPSQVDMAEAMLNELAHNLHHPVLVFILQVLTIVFFARLLGFITTKMGQPTVIGEIAAGIVLGPSVVGAFFPEFSAYLFAPQSLQGLQSLSQLGLVLFMFIIGMELDVNVLRKQASAAVVVSHASIVFPYSLGVGLAYFLYERFAPLNISFLAFALFMGIAMSITAFPVLARIVQERGLSKTPLGATVITCAAADDVTAWCLLAAVIAIVKAGTALNALMVIALSTVYVLAMIYGVRPFLVKLADVYRSKESVNKTVIAFIFLLLLVSAFIAEFIGIHALFGAFLAGAIIPHNLQFKEIIVEKIEDVSLVLLLPLFFVFTGLRTQIGLLNTPHLWLLCGLVILVAVTGKFLGSSIAARYTGQTWADSLAIGALMNTRGLMELVVLNIGYDLGVLSPEIFVMMVLMALGTTLMTGPALDLIDRFARREPKTAPQIGATPRFNVLISFAVPRMGSTLLELLAYFTAKQRDQLTVTALHITPNSQVSPIDAAIFEQEGFEPIKESAQEMGIALQTKYRATEDVVAEVKETATEKPYDLLLVGGAKSLFSEDKTGGVVHGFLEEVETDVGVLIARQFGTVRRAVLLLGGPADAPLLRYAALLAEHGQVQLSLVLPDKKQLDEIKKQDEPNFLRLGSVKVEDVAEAMQATQHDLALMSLERWLALSEAEEAWIDQSPSVLVLRTFVPPKS